jgi:hypothetical protein
MENTETLKNYTAGLLIESHGAEDIWVASTFPTIIAKVNSTEVKAIATYDFIELLGDGEREFSFCCAKAALKNPIWNLTKGTVDSRLCNEGTHLFTMINVTINGNRAGMYPSTISLSQGEESKITINYPFQPNHEYMFILLDDIGNMYRSYHSTPG